MTDAILNHTGLCVTDLERSADFYRNVFGFTYWRTFDAPDEGSAQLLQLEPPVGLRAEYLRLGSWVLELLWYKDAGTTGTDKAMNTLGLTHISVSVPDVDDVLAKVPKFGGVVLEATNIGAGVMVRDPDGQLIEILTMGYADEVAKIP
jgi:catechol 2,3-dioxygenase-like lactoylglutathione lyase family enzyme